MRLVGKPEFIAIDVASRGWSGMLGNFDYKSGGLSRTGR